MSSLITEAGDRIQSDVIVRTSTGEILIEKTETDVSSRAAAYVGRFAADSDKK